MSMYASTKTLPYVYKLVHKITGEYYFGCRWANKLPSSSDLGTKYFTSSKHVKNNFDEFDILILAEFFDYNDAWLFEQSLIHENWADDLILNKHYSVGNKHHYVSDDETRLKQRMSKLGENNPNYGKETWNKHVRGYKMPVRSEEYKKQSSLRQIGRTFSSETKTKMSISAKERAHKSNPKQMRKICKCIHCGIETTMGNIKRWHNDNCKLRSEIIQCSTLPTST